MPRTPRRRSISGIYHVMLRGANKQEIFHDDEDNMKFLVTLKKYADVAEASVYSWCLMNNHVHLLVKEGSENISVTMKRIGVSFVAYYNWKYKTTGHLFQDRFRSENIETKRSFLTVVRYIHQNPQKAGIADRLEDWRWSSYRGYYGKKVFPEGLLEPDVVFELFSPEKELAMKEFQRFHEIQTTDHYLDTYFSNKIRLTDEEARLEILKTLDGLHLAQVKSLPRKNRNDIIRKIKGIEGISQRQLARIVGVSQTIISRS